MRWLVALACMGYAASSLSAADWPQWLGPRRNGSSSETVAPWTGALTVLWRQRVGEGHSSPIVAGGKVYLHTKVADKDAEEITAYDAATGKQQWRHTYERGKFASIFGVGPRATPAVADGKLYAIGVTGALTCLNAEDGMKIWQIDTLKEFNAPNLVFGVSCSPLVDGKRVVVNVGGKGASVVAFDGGNGKVLWKTLDDRASYSSPIIVSAGRTRQLLQLTQQGLVALAPATGELHWRFAFVDKLNESSTTPVHVGQTGSAGLRLESKDGKPGATEIWKKPELTCYFSTPVPVGKQHVYMVTGQIAITPESTLHCVELQSGKSLWQRPKTGRYHAALLRTGDNKLLLLDDNGNLALFEPDPKEYRELARARVCGQTWAHPALADGRLYLRDDKELLCLEMKPAR
jgi:outer membrane protein assembly factor BamB